MTKVPYNKSRRAFNFVFLLNKENIKPDRSHDIYDGRDAASLKSGKGHTHMHVMWTGSKKLMPDQKVEQQYPIDFSLANYDDGYSARQWNLILPSKKPREVVVSFLLNF